MLEGTVVLRNDSPRMSVRTVFRAARPSGLAIEEKIGMAREPSHSPAVVMPVDSSLLKLMPGETNPL